MKRLLYTITALSALTATAMTAKGEIRDIDSLVKAIGSIDSLAMHVDYAATLPNVNDDIKYELELFGCKNPTDPLSSDSYLIEWSLTTPSGHSTGFSAYSAGHHYRFHNDRLYEYHIDWDSIPFKHGGGVHRKVQFAELMPQQLAENIVEMVTDTVNYTVDFIPSTIRNGHDCAVVDAKQIYDGMTVRRITMAFDSQTALPVKIVADNNIGTLSEQSISATFTPLTGKPFPGLDEEALIVRHPVEFEQFRLSNYRVENLAGRPFPRFSLPTLTGERYSRERNQPFAYPTLIVLADPDVASTAETIALIRKGLGAIPVTTRTIYAFTGHDIDKIESLVGEIHPDETILTSARSLARDCGVTSFPTLIFVDRYGIIKSTQTGHNNNLDKIVINNTIDLSNLN